MMITIIELQDELKRCGVHLKLHEIKKMLKDLEIAPTINQRSTIIGKRGKLIKGPYIPAYYSEEPLINLFPIRLLQFNAALKKYGCNKFDEIIEIVNKVRY